jgi:hypothetical protein
MPQFSLRLAEKLKKSPTAPLAVSSQLIAVGLFFFVLLDLKGFTRPTIEIEWYTTALPHRIYMPN